MIIFSGDPTVGTFVVRGAMLLLLVGLVLVNFRHRLVDAREAPTLKEILDGLRYGKPIKSQWKSVDEKNRNGFTIYVFCFLGLGILLFAGNSMARFIDRF